MNCDVCGDEITSMLPYSCNECGGTHCSDHRLPEKHHCASLRKTDGPWFQGVSKGKPKTLSNVEDTETDRWNRHGGYDKHLPSNRKKSDTRPTPGEGDVTGDPDDKYREANASEKCASCGASLFEYEAAGCPHCGETYCGDDFAEHRRDCNERDPESIESTKTVAEHYQKRTKERQNERTTRTDKLEEQRKERFSSPDVNLDGSLSKANYEEDIESIAEEENDPSASTGLGLISRIINWFSA